MIGKVLVTSTGYDPNGPRVRDYTLEKDDMRSKFPISPVPHTVLKSMPQDPAAVIDDGGPVGWIQKVETFLWSSQPPDDPDWKPEEVHLVLSLLSGPHDERPPMKLVMRYKSAKSYGDQIESLAKTFKAVWGLRTF